ncbi:3-hydroxyisobutyrate dehydrogenase [Marinactinospora thermotolerans DSM 45154]|uniref:3-hydroxyisobutyrate dehydrogenase n=1 Tax=Marinactinospora thermotolerans DSM 45154 TaxID=1122192 RepID=A0A1T4R642_9ACTN|nr:NAD(P)-dependent oxidoreductase [Marinactinospora thermotolerans]SKA11395.1 3-hydroxyisobutyrate dehydrogenase [Marinactinospora thermotolerans DSM 45154]
MHVSVDKLPAPTVAVLGTGVMGAPMARNIAAAGLAVHVWNRTRAKAESLAEAGITVAEDPAAAVRTADIVLTMLTDGPAVEEVMRGIGVSLEGKVWAQTTTVGPEAATRLADLAAERGMAFVDAPVVGTRGPAEAGGLKVLAACDADVRDRLVAVFDAIGSETVWLDGGPGAASRLKLVVNNWVLALNTATGETLALARALGVEAQYFLGTVAGGPLDAGYLRAKAEAILEEDFTPDFSVANAAKDARLILDAAEREGIRLDVAEATARRFERAVREGHGGRDMAAAYLASFDGER